MCLRPGAGTAYDAVSDLASAEDFKKLQAGKKQAGRKVCILLSGRPSCEDDDWTGKRAY